MTYDLLSLQSLDFKELTKIPLLAGLPCRSYFDLSFIITVAVNWIVVEVVTSSWGFLGIVFTAGARIVWKIHKHFEVHELG